MTNLTQLANQTARITERVLLHPYVSTAIMILFVLYGTYFMPTPVPGSSAVLTSRLPEWMLKDWVGYVFRAVGLTLIAIVLSHDLKIGVMVAVIFMMLYTVLHAEFFKIQVLNFTQEQMTNSRIIGSQYKKVKKYGGVEKMTPEEEQAIAAAQSSSMLDAKKSIDELIMEIETLMREKAALGFISEQEQLQVRQELDKARNMPADLSLSQLQQGVAYLTDIRMQVSSLNSPAPMAPAPMPAESGPSKEEEVIEVKLAENGVAAAEIPAEVQKEANVIDDSPRMGDKLVVENGNGERALTSNGEVTVAQPIVAITPTGEVAKDELGQEILTVPVQAVNQHGHLARDAQGRPVVAPVVLQKDHSGNIRTTRKGDLLAKRCKVMCDTTGIYMMRKDGVLAPLNYEPFSKSGYASARW